MAMLTRNTPCTQCGAIVRVEVREVSYEDWKAGTPETWEAATLVVDIGDAALHQAWHDELEERLAALEAP